MQLSARRALAIAAFTAALAQPALATEQSVSTICSVASSTHIASAQPKAPVVEASLLRNLISLINHLRGQDGGGSGTGDTIHRG